MKALLCAAWTMACICHAAQDEVCAACHRAIYESYESSPMALSSGGVEPSHISGPGAEFTAAGGVRYRVVSTAQSVEAQISDGAQNTTHLLRYFLGAGMTGRSYVYESGNFLFESPVAFYASTGKWDLSPGYESSDHVNVTRPVEASCLNCHASGIRALPGTRNGFERPAFTQAGVSCERCHGPADQHLARMRAAKTGSVNQPGESGIINPARLESVRRDSICAQCHLVGVIRVARKNKTAYAPGQVLFDSAAVFLWKDGERPLPANSHFEQLSRSLCWRRSDGRMWCGDCHDPHRVVPVAERAAYYRSRCQACHARNASRCSANPGARQKAGNDCVSCHMTSRKTATVQHSAQTDHTIPRIPQFQVALSDRESNDLPAGAELTPFPGTQAGRRELGLAYAAEGLRTGRQTWGIRAYQFLRGEYESNPDDHAVGDQLAQLLDKMGKEDEACRIFLHISDDPQAATGALINAGTCLAKDGKLDRAIPLWRRALAANPGEEAARLNLAVALYRTGAISSARMALEDGLKLDPFWTRARELLVTLH